MNDDTNGSTITSTPMEFRPHALLRNGHAQTLVGIALSSETLPADVRHEVLLDDGDRVIIHENVADSWQPTDRTVLMLHGLAGCHASAYMMRVASRLRDQGLRVFRMDMRAVGDGADLAKKLMHAGRWEDAAAALQKIAQLAPQSATTLLGFSLGANVALLAAALADDSARGNCDSCIAVAPPADLLQCCLRMRTGVRRLYDRYLLRHMLTHMQSWWKRNPDALRVDLQRKPRSIYAFDELITAPLGGFRDAEHYYASSSCGPRLKEIEIPTRILAAANDPMVPIQTIRNFRRPSHVRLYETKSGGHLGYVASRSNVSDRRWLDHTLVEWVCNELG